MDDGEQPYAQRQTTTHLDGSPIFKSAEDERSEDEVARIIERQWNCKLVSLGKLASIDWIGLRHGRVVGVLELKTRNHASSKFPTVFLNLRKWLALTLAAVALDAPAIFVVRFRDALMWTPLSRIDPQRVKIGGCREIVKSRNDIEPVILVDISLMSRLA